ncbi:MAG: hypothetical protein ACI4SH_06535 [Candidatus Scatosoma sp.]
MGNTVKKRLKTADFGNYSGVNFKQKNKKQAKKEEKTRDGKRIYGQQAVAERGV